MRGFAILIGFQFLGVALHRIGVPIPGSVLGMILFSAALFAGWVKLEWVDKPASLLLRNMLLFFVPVVVTLTRLSAVLTAQWIPIAGSLIVSLVAVVLTTGLVSHRLLRDRNRPGDLD